MFLSSSCPIVDFFSSMYWATVEVEVPSTFVSCFTSPRCSFVRFIPDVIIHGGKTFKDVLSVSDLTPSPLPSVPLKSTTTCPHPLIDYLAFKTIKEDMLNGKFKSCITIHGTKIIKQVRKHVHDTLDPQTAMFTTSGPRPSC